MTLPYWLQLALIVQYLVLAVLFAKTNAWPVSVYYLGCFVKDSAVLILAYFGSQL